MCSVSPVLPKRDLLKGQEQQPYVVAVAEPCFQVLLTLQFHLMSCVIKPGQHGDEFLLEQD